LNCPDCAAGCCPGFCDVSASGGVPDVAAAVPPVEVVAPVAMSVWGTPFIAWAVLALVCLSTLWFLRRW